MRPLLAVIATAVCFLSPVCGRVVASAAPDSTPAPVVTTQEVPADCIGNSNPGPDCGTEPKASGDLGGSAQIALFGATLGGMAVVFAVIVRSTRARARAAEDM
jgi:hypothetical protein